MPRQRRAPQDMTLRAGSFGAWLRDFQRSLLQGTRMAVPCGDCTSCCTSSRFIHIDSSERRTLNALPRRLLFAAPLMPAGTFVLGYDNNGRCPMLRGIHCSIYRDRPLTCRMFDCRVLAASGLISPIDSGDPVHRQAGRWDFSYINRRDRRAHAAVQAAAEFLVKHHRRLPENWLPEDPIQRSLIAVIVHRVFLRTPKNALPRTTIDKVIHAYEAFKARRTVI